RIRGGSRTTARSGPVLRLLQSRAASSVFGLPDPGGGVRDAGALRSQATPARERGIVWMRAALAPIPDRAIPHRAPSLGRGPGTTHGRPDGEPVDDGRAPHPLGHRAGRREGGRATPAAGL